MLLKKLEFLRKNYTCRNEVKRNINIDYYYHRIVYQLKKQVRKTGEINLRIAVPLYISEGLKDKFEKEDLNVDIKRYPHAHLYSIFHIYYDFEGR